MCFEIGISACREQGDEPFNKLAGISWVAEKILFFIQTGSLPYI
jgi:hypothetical protein